MQVFRPPSSFNEQPAPIIMKTIFLNPLLSSLCFWTAVIPTAVLSAADDPLDWVRPEVPAPDAEGWITLFDGAVLHACEPDSIRNRTDRIGVQHGELWLDNSGVSFNVNARNVALRAIVKKVSGQNVMLKCRQNQGRSYGFWFNGGNHFGLGMYKPQWTGITDARATRNFPDFFQMELIANNSLITLKANDETVKAFEDLAIDESGAVGISTYLGKSHFKKIQVKILDAPPPPLSWTNTEGKTIQAEFIRLEGESVVVRKDGKDMPIPFAKLSLASRNQARNLAAKLPASPETPAAAVPSAKSFGKQDDPDHQRKLAESVLEKKGQIEIWRGTGHLLVRDAGNLPAGKLELKAVDAIGAPFSDEDALLLNGCKELKRLRLHRSSVEALPFESLIGLELLEIFSSRVSLSALAALQGHKNIRDFSLWHPTTPVGKGIVPLVASMPNIVTLNLHKAGIDGDSLTPLTKLKFLRNLNLGGNDCTDADLAALSAFVALENLNLWDTSLIEHSLVGLRGVKSLRSIDLGSCRLGERTLAGLAEIPSLSVLQLYNSSLSDEMLAPLSGHKGLRELLISETPITGGGFANLKPLPNVTRVQFEGGKTRINAMGFHAILQACPNVSNLAISARNLPPGTLTELASLRNLTTLTLSGGATLDAESILQLSGMKLSTLVLDGSNVSNDLLAGFLPLKSKLAHLQLRDTRISDSCLATLEQFRGLTSLHISGTDITKEGAARLRKSLRTCLIHH